MNLNAIYNEIHALLKEQEAAIYPTFHQSGQKFAYRNVLEKLAEYGFDQPGTHAHPWGVDDVHAHLKGRYRKLSDADAAKVVEHAFKCHDADIGLNNEALECAADALGLLTPIKKRK